MTINKVILLGNLGKDPEIRTKNDGKEIVTFSLATSESWKDKNTGEKKTQTQWHQIVAFTSVDFIKNYVKKGSKIYLEGVIQYDKYVDKAGIEKYTTEIVMNPYKSTIKLLDSKPITDEKKKSEDDMNIGDEIPF